MTERKLHDSSVDRKAYVTALKLSNNHQAHILSLQKDQLFMLSVGDIVSASRLCFLEHHLLTNVEGTVASNPERHNSAEKPEAFSQSPAATTVVSLDDIEIEELTVQ